MRGKMLSGRRERLRRVLPNPPDVWIGLHDGHRLHEEQQTRSQIQKHRFIHEPIQFGKP